jgi:GDP-mannose 6-dehydrogenase
MRVSVLGLGYVGCVSSVCLAKAGHDIVGVEVNREKVEMVNRGVSPIVEPGLDALLAEVVASGRLRATLSTDQAIGDTDVSLICVGTPGRANGQLDTGAIARAGREVGHALRRRGEPFTVVLRSTALPGTTESVLVPAVAEGAARAPGSWLRVAANPEFLREGLALHDFAHPPLTLAGSAVDETASLVQSLYGSVEAPFVRTSIRTAEMVKYAANAFHALKICFANEIGDLCSAFGADGQDVMRIFRMDHKLNVSEAYLRPGFAFGGSCLPKDLRALLHAGRAVDVSSLLLSSILPSNEARLRRTVEAVLETRRRKVGLVGLAFKPGTDDLRESPLVTLAEILVGKGCEVRILDRSVAIARLMGANRRYIEEEIPHLAALMCADGAALLDHAEVVVIGNGSEDAAHVLRGVRPDHVVIDLTRGAVGESLSPDTAVTSPVARAAAR